MKFHKFLTYASFGDALSAEREPGNHKDKYSVYLREWSLFVAGVGTEEKVLYALKNILLHHLPKSNFLSPPKENSKKGAFMLKYGICFYTTSVVKNHSSTPPSTAYVSVTPPFYLLSPPRS